MYQFTMGRQRVTRSDGSKVPPDSARITKPKRLKTKAAPTTKTTTKKPKKKQPKRVRDEEYDDENENYYETAGKFLFSFDDDLKYYTF